LEIYSVLRYTTLHKAERYCEACIDAFHRYFNVLGIWKDYISFCEELGYDLKNEFVLFPKNLYQTHDQTSREVLYKREQEKKVQMLEEDRKARVLLKEYAEIYPWTEGAFSVLVPRDLLEIREEGFTLHHCVANYASRVANGETIILLVRKLHQPERPFYTLEVKNGRIIQCRGYGNKDMTEDVEDFVRRYEKAVLKKIQAAA
jgi:hypothetical protein